MNTIKLYRHALSGHSHRVELFLSLLNMDYELIDVDLLAGAHDRAQLQAVCGFQVGQRAQHLQRGLPVLMLRALRFATDGETGRDVLHPHR